MPSTASVMAPILHHLLESEEIHPGPVTPEGVYARLVDSRVLYVNSTAVRQLLQYPAVGGKR